MKSSRRAMKMSGTMAALERDGLGVCGYNVQRVFGHKEGRDDIMVEDDIIKTDENTAMMSIDLTVKSLKAITRFQSSPLTKHNPQILSMKTETETKIPENTNQEEFTCGKFGKNMVLEELINPEQASINVEGKNVVVKGNLKGGVTAPKVQEDIHELNPRRDRDTEVDNKSIIEVTVEKQENEIVLSKISKSTSNTLNMPSCYRSLVLHRNVEINNCYKIAASLHYLSFKVNWEYKDNVKTIKFPRELI